MGPNSQKGDPAVAIHLAAYAIKVAVHQDYWNALLAALSEFNDRRMSELTAAPQDRVFNAQGRAQGAAEILRMFVDCTEKVRSYEQSKK